MIYITVEGKFVNTIHQNLDDVNDKTNVIELGLNMSDVPQVNYEFGKYGRHVYVDGIIGVEYFDRQLTNDEKVGQLEQRQVEQDALLMQILLGGA